MLKTCLVIWSVQSSYVFPIENEHILVQYRNNETLNVELKDVPHIINEEMPREVNPCEGILEKMKHTFSSALYYLGFGTKLDECGASKAHSEARPTPVIGRDGGSPGIVWYKIGNTMKIDLLIQKIPDQGSCSIYITKGTDFISKSIFHGLHNQTIEAGFELTEQDDNVMLEVSLRGLGNCNKVKTPLYRLKKTTDEPSTRCLTRACTVTLDWNEWRNLNSTFTRPPRVTARSGGSGSPGIPRPQRLRPLVTQAALNTTERLAITCNARGRPFDVLTWYQVKGSEVIYLVENTTVAQKDRVSELYVTLNKTLEDSDRDTYIFCASGDFSDGVFSENVTLSFDNVQNTTSNQVGPSSPVKILAISASVLAVALIILGVATWRRRHGKSKPEGKEEENEIYYVSAGVTYAILDMETPVSDTKPIKKGDLPPYTKIIGAYKARN